MQARRTQSLSGMLPVTGAGSSSRRSRQSAGPSLSHGHPLAPARMLDPPVKSVRKAKGPRKSLLDGGPSVLDQRLAGLTAVAHTALQSFVAVGSTEGSQDEDEDTGLQVFGQGRTIQYEAMRAVKAASLGESTFLSGTQLLIRFPDEVEDSDSNLNRTIATCNLATFLYLVLSADPESATTTRREKAVALAQAADGYLAFVARHLRSPNSSSSSQDDMVDLALLCSPENLELLVSLKNASFLAGSANSRSPLAPEPTFSKPLEQYLSDSTELTALLPREASERFRRLCQESVALIKRTKGDWEALTTRWGYEELRERCVEKVKEIAESWGPPPPPMSQPSGSSYPYGHVRSASVASTVRGSTRPRHSTGSERAAAAAAHVRQQSLSAYSDAEEPEIAKHLGALPTPRLSRTLPPVESDDSSSGEEEDEDEESDQSTRIRQMKEIMEMEEDDDVTQPLGGPSGGGTQWQSQSQQGQTDTQDRYRDAESADSLLEAQENEEDDDSQDDILGSRTQRAKLAMEAMALSGEEDLEEDDDEDGEEEGEDQLPDDTSQDDVLGSETQRIEALKAIMDQDDDDEEEEDEEEEDENEDQKTLAPTSDAPTIGASGGSFISRVGQGLRQRLSSVLIPGGGSSPIIPRSTAPAPSSTLAARTAIQRNEAGQLVRAPVKERKGPSIFERRPDATRIGFDDSQVVPPRGPSPEPEEEEEQESETTPRPFGPAGKTKQKKKSRKGKERATTADLEEAAELGRNEQDVGGPGELELDFAEGPFDDLPDLPPASSSRAAGGRGASRVQLEEEATPLPQEQERFDYGDIGAGGGFDPIEEDEEDADADLREALANPHLQEVEDDDILMMSGFIASGIGGSQREDEPATEEDDDEDMSGGKENSRPAPAPVGSSSYRLPTTQPATQASTVMPTSKQPATSNLRAPASNSNNNSGSAVASSSKRTIDDAGFDVVSSSDDDLSETEQAAHREQKKARAAAVAKRTRDEKEAKRREEERQAKLDQVPSSSEEDSDSDDSDSDAESLDSSEADEREKQFARKNGKAKTSKKLSQSYGISQLEPNRYRQDRGGKGGKVPWLDKEVDLLIEELKSIGPDWAQIMKRHGPKGFVSRVFRNRTNVSLKDKHRVMVRQYEREGRKMPAWLTATKGDFKKKK